MHGSDAGCQKVLDNYFCIQMQRKQRKSNVKERKDTPFFLNFQLWYSLTQVQGLLQYKKHQFFSGIPKTARLDGYFFFSKLKIKLRLISVSTLSKHINKKGFIVISCPVFDEQTTLTNDVLVRSINIYQQQLTLFYADKTPRIMKNS